MCCRGRFFPAPFPTVPTVPSDSTRNARVAQSPTHRRDLRSRGGGHGVRALVMELVEGRRLPSGSPRRDSGRRGAADRAADRRGARGCARARHHPSRSEARQRQAHAERHRQGPGFRPRETAEGSATSAPNAIAGVPCADVTAAGDDRRDSRDGALHGPEQARGKTVDKRADIWAFGCVLSRCSPGRPFAGGRCFTLTLSAILQSEPEWSRCPRSRCPSRHVFSSA